MASHVDNVVDAPEDAVITVCWQDGAIGGVIRPVAPVLALRVLAVLLVVLIDEALRIAPDGLHDAGPGISNTNIPRCVGAGFNFFSLLVPDHRINSECGRTRASRLHGIQSRLCGAQEAAGFRLPP